MVMAAKIMDKKPKKKINESNGLITPPKLVKSLILASCSDVNVRRITSGTIRKKIIATEMYISVFFVFPIFFLPLLANMIKN